MKKKKEQYIMVVDPCSSAVNYIKDIIDKGYTPLVLEMAMSDPNYENKYRPFFRKFYFHCSKVIKGSKDYRQTLNSIKKYHPVCGVASAEFSVPLTARILNDLKLPSISYKLINQYVDKYYMNEALKRAHLRYIRGSLIYNVKEGVDLYKKLHLKSVIVKPTFGSGSYGLSICNSQNEVKIALQKLFSSNNLYNQKITKILMQEVIRGKEYFMNTISLNGQHKTISCSSYSVRNASNEVIIDSFDVIDLNSKIALQLKEYLFKVLDALNIKDGPVHSELFIDDKGPVLIEVNCRICGADIPSEFFDKIYGTHDSKEILDVLVDRKIKFSKPKFLNNGSELLAYVPHKTIIVDLPILTILNNLPSTFRHTFNYCKLPLAFNSDSANVLDSIGYIYLVSKKPLKHDVELLKSILIKYYLLAYQCADEDSVKISFENTNANLKISKQIKGANNLIITDNYKNYKNLKGDFVTLMDISKNKKKYSNVIIDFPIKTMSDTIKRSILFELLYKSFNKINVDGKLYITSRVYNYLPYQVKGLELLLDVINFKHKKMPNYLIATK